MYSWKNPVVSRDERLRHGKPIKLLPKVEKGTEEGSGKEWQWKVEPGISTFASHPQHLSAYLRPLFTNALSVIPQQEVANTPVYVMATAGMRFLSASQQDAVIRATCSFIDNETPFNIRGHCRDHVQVITGEEEGLLGWIAINYLMDGFPFKEAKSPLPAESDESGPLASKDKSTYGFLDMGGASTQIAFEPSKSALNAVNHAQDNQPEDLVNVTLRLLDGTQVTHQVFVTTFLGFGTNKARERYEEALVANFSLNAPHTIPLSDPCLLKGSSTGAGTLASPTIYGTGSFKSCLTSLAPLLNKSLHCSHPPCLFHGVHVPPIDFSINHFIGVSEYWFSSNDVFNLGGTYDYVSFQKAAEDFCKRPWNELEESLRKSKTLSSSGGGEFSPQVDEGRLKMQCFKSAWMVTVLHEGIGLPRVIDRKGKGDGKHHAEEVGWKAGQKNLGGGHDNDIFQSVNEVEGTVVSWTLGKAALQATKDIPPIQSHGSAPESDGSQSKNGSAAEHLWRPRPPWYALDGSLDSHLPASMQSVQDAGSIIVALTVVLLVLLGLTVLLASCGRSPDAIRRRKFLRSSLPLVLGCGSGSIRRSKGACGAGGYGLANMEEGGDVRNRLLGIDDLPLSEDFGPVTSEMSSSEEDVTTASRSDGALPQGYRRKQSSGGILSLLPFKVRGWVLKTASRIPGTTAAARRSLHNRRRQARKARLSTFEVNLNGLYSLRSTYTSEDELQMHGLQAGSNIRRAFSLSVMREPRAAYPAFSALPQNVIDSATSRPSSRTAFSGRQSPRVLSTSGGSAALSLTPLSTSPPSLLHQQQQLLATLSSFWHLRPSSPSYFAPSNGGGTHVTAFNSVPVAWTSSSSMVPSASTNAANTPRSAMSFDSADASLASVSADKRENQSRWKVGGIAAHTEGHTSAAASLSGHDPSGT